MTCGGSKDHCGMCSLQVCMRNGSTAQCRSELHMAPQHKAGPGGIMGCVHLLTLASLGAGHLRSSIVLTNCPRSRRRPY